MALLLGSVCASLFVDEMCGINGNAATQAAPLIASPTMIVALLSPEVREASSMY
jgi:hypothetical protein